MPSQRPYREPCGGYKVFKGCCNQQDPSPILVDKYVNTTVVDNWDTGVGGTIAPYERWTQDLSGGDSCEVHYCVVDGAPCGAWLRPIPDNTWSHSGTVNFAVTRKYGFKNVQAARCWNGQFGYMDLESCNGQDTVLACDSGANILTYRGYQSAPNSTRYGQLVIEVTWDELENYLGPDAGPAPNSQTASMQQSIGANTGLRTVDSLALSPNKNSNDAFAQIGIGFYNFTQIFGMFLNPVTSLIGQTVTYTSGGFTVTLSGVTYETMVWDLAAGTFHRTVYDTDPDGVYKINFEETASVSDTVFSYDYSAPVNGNNKKYGTRLSPLHLTVTGTFSSPITDADVYADIKTLLDQWNLADDKQYPFRTDNKTGVAPLVTRDELNTQNFDSTGFYIRDYGSPVVDGSGYTLGDPDWAGDTGYTDNPNPKTGYGKAYQEFFGHNSGEAIDIQIPNPFSHCDATSFAIAGGSLPPGVSMDGSGHITGTIGDDGHYGVTVLITGAAAAATGNILGAPKPAGYQNFFDFLFTDYRACCYEPIDNPGVKNYIWYQVGWGQDVVTFNSNTGCTLPLNSTHWTNWWEAAGKPSGAWIFYADQRQDYYPGSCVPSSGGSGSGNSALFVAQKWCEILESWPSQNFAKPAGDMKFWYDENKVACATNVSGSGAGSVWGLLDPLTGLAPTWPDVDQIVGGPSVGGFYLISAWDGTNATLGAKQFDVPSDWSSKSNGDDSACFGVLRWSTYPSLLGRVAVTVSGTTFTFAAAKPAFGMNASTHQESIDIYDSTMALLASSITATRTSDTTFTTASAYPTAAFIQIHGAAKWYMNDDSSKGDYVEMEWLADTRSYGESGRVGAITDCDSSPVGGGPSTNAGGGPLDEHTQFASFSQTQGCLPFQPCSPKVVCISPNGESFPNGITYDFPESFVCDVTYGSKWWGYVQQTMTDLFWQQPHRPCNIDTCAKWQADDGTCQDDIAGSCPDDPPTYFFPLPDQVEPRLTLPNNYGAAQNESPPALPADIQIGWLSPVTHVSSDGDVAYPPEAGRPDASNGDPGGTLGPWLLHANLCASQAGGCRFNYNYPRC